MAATLAEGIGEIPAPWLIGGVVSLTLFVAWVIVSERRTRHLSQLIRAVRGSDRPDARSRDRRRVGR